MLTGQTHHAINSTSNLVGVQLEHEELNLHNRDLLSLDKKVKSYIVFDVISFMLLHIFGLAVA